MLVHTQNTRVNRFDTPIEAGVELYDLLDDPGKQKNIFDSSNPVVRNLASH